MDSKELLALLGITCMFSLAMTSEIRIKSKVRIWTIQKSSFWRKRLFSTWRVLDILFPCQHNSCKRGVFFKSTRIFWDLFLAHYKEYIICFQLKLTKFQRTSRTPCEILDTHRGTISKRACPPEMTCSQGPRPWYYEGKEAMAKFCTKASRESKSKNKMVSMMVSWENAFVWIGHYFIYNETREWLVKCFVCIKKFDRHHNNDSSLSRENTIHDLYFRTNFASQ